MRADVIAPRGQRGLPFSLLVEFAAPPCRRLSPGRVMSNPRYAGARPPMRSHQTAQLP